MKNTRINTAKGKSNGIIAFISIPVKQKLVDNEKKLGTEISHQLSYQTINNCPDEVIMNILARALRPTSKADYQKKLFDSITKLKPKYENWTFTPNASNYDEVMHGPVSKLLNEIKDLDEFFRKGATPEDLQTFPKFCYGKKHDPGVIWIFTECFGEYRSNFVTAIGEDSLKSFTNTKEFVDHVQALNNRQAQRARENRRENEKFIPPVEAEAIFKQSVDRDFQNKFRDGQQFHPTQLLVLNVLR